MADAPVPVHLVTRRVEGSIARMGSDYGGNQKHHRGSHQQSISAEHKASPTLLLLASTTHS
jgi:hypothetical protein